MPRIFLNFFLLILIFITSNCGFKILDKSEFNNFSIINISTEGDKRISYRIKNELLYNNKGITKGEKLDIILNVAKKRNVKEKSIKNEITKYEIVLNIKILFEKIEDQKTNEINFASAGDYLVGENHSTTISNEKRLIENLIENISEEIISRIGDKLNDI